MVLRRPTRNRGFPVCSRFRHFVTTFARPTSTVCRVLDTRCRNAITASVLTSCGDFFAKWPRRSSQFGGHPINLATFTEDQTARLSPRACVPPDVPTSHVAHIAERGIWLGQTRSTSRRHPEFVNLRIGSCTGDPFPRRWREPDLRRTTTGAPCCVQQSAMWYYTVSSIKCCCCAEPAARRLRAFDRFRLRVSGARCCSRGSREVTDIVRVARCANVVSTSGPGTIAFS